MNDCSTKKRQVSVNEKLKDPNIGKTLELPLKKVKADYDWNCRKLAGEKETDLKGETEKNDFDSLMRSIDVDGQSTPVMVRPKGAKGDYELVAGFRRYRALQLLAEKNGDKDPKILASVRDLNDYQARAENVRENAGRKNVEPTELLTGLIDLREQARAAKLPDSIQALADSVGIGRPYASRLFKIAENLKAELLKKWMESPTAIGVNRVENVAKVDKDRQDEEWATQAESGGRGAGGGGGENAWLTSATKAAERVGTILGRLEGFKLIDTEKLNFVRDIEKLIAVKEGATDEEKKALSESASKAYVDAIQEARNPKPPEEPKVKKGPKAKSDDQPAN
jgi:ParB/RepB/Spo0J family partition protein